MILVAATTGIYVIKLGTSLITDVRTNEVRIESLSKITDQIANIKEHKGVIVVSSGAIGLGLHAMGLDRRPREMAKKQAAAAIGQNKLMNQYEKLFQKRGVTIAQVLLTKDGISGEPGYTNAHNTIHTLVDYGIVPIINENDTIATEEIQFGDNDNLAAYVAQIADAELLILLTDTDGLYDADPTVCPGAHRYEVIDEITPDICNSAGQSNGLCSVGGMCSKIQAAQRATSHGIPVIIANGFEDGIIERIARGEHCGTLFVPHTEDTP
ncbi:MAG: glutamate 5-kinase [Candidatus Methanofastidiosa archaeon]|nr:glutamate 5-kinase [Candidatus Methanofastidiosa archaeon]